MKRRDLEKKLKAAGWYLLRNGGAHDVWTDGKEITTIPRHAEINERLAKAIIKKWGL